LGTLQINGGLAQVIGIPENALWQLIIIGVVCGLATISVSLGLDKGIKVLSNINIVMAVLLLIFIVVFGPTLFMAKGVFESLGTYIQQLPELALWNDTFANTGWQNTWTVFYWAWTITWSPFVGIFIARISRGRDHPSVRHRRPRGPLGVLDPVVRHLRLRVLRHRAERGRGTGRPRRR
jgi:choline/glycine/proline betaine transport protein